MNDPLQLNTDYVIFSPTLAQQINSMGIPIQGCSSWYDVSQLSSVQCSSFIGLNCTSLNGLLSFLGVTSLANAVSVQFILGSESGTIPNNGVYYSNAESTTPAYGMSIQDGSYFCASTSQTNVSPAFFHLSDDFSDPVQGVGINSCASESGGSKQDTIWNTGSNNCAFSTTIEDEGWLIERVFSQNPTDNLVRLGDVVRFYNSSWQKYFGVNDTTWGNSIPNDNYLNLTPTNSSQPQTLLILYDSPPPSGPDFTLFQILPVGGLLPLSFNPTNFSAENQLLCPCPMTQCPSSLCNTGTLMYIDPVGGQGCPVICQFDPQTTNCTFQIDPALCSICKSSQCGNCTNDEICARDLNSGGCACVPILKTTQEIQNKNFWIYVIIALIIVVVVIGGGYMAWVFFSDKYSDKQKDILALKKNQQSSSIDYAIGQVFGLDSKK